MGVRIKTKPTLVFILLIVVYLIIHFFRRQNLYMPTLINSYLTDIICMPIILTICQIGINLINRFKNYRLTLKMILIMPLYYSFIFEFLLPKYSQAYTPDYWDVVCYFLGAILFFFFQMYTRE